MSDIQISAHQLQIHYESLCALSIEALELSGNVIALLGHNGAGKSTFIKAILGLLKPKNGTLLAKDLLGNPLSPSRDFAFCPETGSVFEDISVREYMALWSRLKHGSSSYFRREGSRYLELLEIGPLLRKKGRELSKGERRRVQTAIGFILKPRVFVFDEPLDGLDVQKTEELSSIIQEHRSQMAFLISSHRMDIIERLADHAMVLRQGHLAAYGRTAEVSAALAGESVSIDGAEQPDLLTRQLTAAFPTCVCARLGERIIVTGRLAAQEGAPALRREVASLLRGQVKLKFSSSTPSLVDAMSFHLRQLAAETRTRNVSQLLAA